MEVLSQWKQGIIYPRWAALAHWGYGEARFLFYPPASWTLGAVLGAFLPWQVVPAAYLWVVLCLAGLSMFHLARRWLDLPSAFFAAALYALNPYHLLIVYWRSAYAELMAAALLPLLLLCVLRLEDRGMRPVLCLALVLAGAWLTNAPAAVMIHYSAALLALTVSVLQRSWRPLGGLALAVVLGAGLASFYLVPAAYEEKWVNIAEVLAPGVRPQDNFLFTTISDPDHNRFNLLTSVIAVCEVAALAAAVLLSRQWQRREKSLWTLLAIWGAASAAIMFSITRVLWDYLPQFRFVQLPWRWLLCLNVALAMLLAVAASRWTGRVLVCTALLATVVIAGYRIQPPWWDTAADIREMQDAMASGAGYEGTDEYVPAGADPYELQIQGPRVVASDSTARIRIVSWDPFEKHLLVESHASGLVTLRLFNYPAWKVTVNNNQVAADTSDVTGQMQIPVLRGMNDIRVIFRRTPDRAAGVLLSSASLCTLLAAWYITRRTRSA